MYEFYSIFLQFLAIFLPAIPFIIYIVVVLNGKLTQALLPTTVRPDDTFEQDKPEIYLGTFLSTTESACGIW